MLVGSTKESCSQVVLRIKLHWLGSICFVFLPRISCYTFQKCPNTWLCISLQTTSSISKHWRNVASGFFLVQDSLSPELSWRSQTNGMPHSFHRSIPLLILEKKNSNFYPNVFKYFPYHPLKKFPWLCK